MDKMEELKFYSLLFGYILPLLYRFPSPPIDTILCDHLFMFHILNFIRPLKLICMEFLALPFSETTKKFAFLLLNNSYFGTLGVSIKEV